MWQRDVFFHAPAGRLKLREVRRENRPVQAELIAYDRPDGGAERLSVYHRVPITQIEALEWALAASLGVRGTVAKRRRLMMSGTMRLHFDEVEGLGTFVEFEAVLLDGTTEADARAHVAQWRSRLNLTDTVDRSYIDLLDAGHGGTRPTHDYSRP
jgi:adenylate cyclase class IV